jgi:hypothetical protein
MSEIMSSMDEIDDEDSVVQVQLPSQTTFALSAMGDDCTAETC